MAASDQLSLRHIPLPGPTLTEKHGRGSKPEILRSTSFPAHFFGEAAEVPDVTAPSPDKPWCIVKIDGQ
jgi:hypothetical protein